MRKYGVAILFVLVFVFVFSSCANRDVYEEAIGDDALLNQSRVQLSADDANSGLSAVQFFSNEFGVGILFRNETGRRLYYDDRFRLDGASMAERNNPAGLQYIDYGETKQVHISWRSSRPTGVYVLERDFFLDSGLTQIFTILSLEFYIVAWNTQGDDIPEDVLALRNEREYRYLSFQLAGGASDVIVLASDVAVSRTGVAFRTANLSALSFIHGLAYRLLVYDDGWRPVPIPSGPVAFLLIGIQMTPGDVIDDRINFGNTFDPLENGRYMIMRIHHRDSPPGAPRVPRVQEVLMVEFVIDDDTPMNCKDFDL